MAGGQELLSFSLKGITHTVSSGPGTAITIQVNFEGTQTGEAAGAVIGTLTAMSEPGAKSGTWKWCGVGLLDTGETLSATAEGIYTSSGKHRWNFHGTELFSDGRTATVEAVGDFAERTLTGKLYELR